MGTIASAIWPLIDVDANISDQLPKLYLFDSLNRTPNVFQDIIATCVSAG